MLRPAVSGHRRTLGAYSTRLQCPASTGAKRAGESSSGTGRGRGVLRRRALLCRRGTSFREPGRRCAQTWGASVFYDEFADLWGKDLTKELEKVYRARSRFVVIFVSQAYVKKAWPNLERQHAPAGRIERMDDSVLPARFDPLELPGLPSTVGYLDIGARSPQELADLVLAKLSRTAWAVPEQFDANQLTTEVPAPTDSKVMAPPDLPFTTPKEKDTAARGREVEFGGHARTAGVVFDSGVIRRAK
jgi:hypothetical protein